MKTQIKHRYTGAVLFESDAETILAAVCEAAAAKTDLSGAYLSGANLYGAYLSRANLSGANLSGADLSRANLYGANLSRANLSDAYLSGADLSRANLYGADLSGANLSGANLSKLLSERTILPDGDLIGWKKLNDGSICKLRIPSDAKRVGGLVGRKCRAEFADVLEGSGTSQNNSHFKYEPGKRVVPDKYDPDPRVECSHGIHFFITREEAEQF